MKTLFALISLVALTLTAFGASVTLAWDANPPAENVSEYRIYEKVGTNYVQVGFTTGTTITITGVASGTHTYVATAFNGIESDYSNEALANVVTTNQPSGPNNLRVTVIVTVDVP